MPLGKPIEDDKDPTVATGFSGYVSQVGKGFGKGLAGLPKSLGVLQEAITDTPAEETGAYQLGEDIEEFFTPGKVDPKIEESFSGKTAEALGQIGAFFAGGFAGGVVKGGAITATTAMGAGLGASSQYEEAGAFGASPEDRLAAAGQGALLGLTEAMPITRALGRVLGPNKVSSFRDAVVGAAKQGGEEALQEGFQSIGENFIAKTSVGYDPERALMDSVGEAAGVGGSAGFVAGLLLNSMGYKMRGATEDPLKADVIISEDGYEIDPLSNYGKAALLAKQSKQKVAELQDYSNITNLTRSRIEGEKVLYNNKDIAEAQVGYVKGDDKQREAIQDYLVKKYIMVDNPKPTDVQEVEDMFDHFGLNKKDIENVETKLEKEKVAEKEEKPGAKKEPTVAEKEPTVKEEIPAVDPTDLEKVTSFKAIFPTEKEAKDTAKKLGADVVEQDGQWIVTKEEPQPQEIVEKPTVVEEPKPFTPTHTTSDGEPVEATETEGFFLDQDGVMVEDPAAEPITPRSVDSMKGGILDTTVPDPITGDEYTLTSFETDEARYHTFGKVKIPKKESPESIERKVPQIFNFLKQNPLLDNIAFSFYRKDTVQDKIPSHLRRHIEQNNPNAFIYGKDTANPEVYINLDKFNNIQQVKGALIHELTGHYGLNKTLGPQVTRVLDSALNNPNIVNEMDKRISAVNYPKREWEADNDYQRRRMEEYVSELAREKFLGGDLTKSDNALLNRIVNKIRHILMKLGVSKEMLTEKDLLDIVQNSYNYTIGREGYSVKDAKPVGEQVDFIKEPEIKGDYISDMQDGVKKANQAAGFKDSRKDTTAIRESNNTHIEAWRDKINRVFDIIHKDKRLKWLTHFTTVRGQKLYEKSELPRRGDIQRYQDQAREFFNLFKKLKLTASEQQIFKDYFLDPTDNMDDLNNYHTHAKNKIRAKKAIDATIKAKQSIKDLGQKLVDLGLMEESVYQKNKGAYLPTLYLDFVINQDLYKGGAKRPSFMNYLKKQHNVTELARELKGEVIDPALIVPDTLGTIGRDVALTEWYHNLKSLNDQHKGLGWFLHPESIEFKGKEFNFQTIEARMDEIKLNLSVGNISDQARQILEDDLKTLTVLRDNLENSLIRNIMDEMEKTGVESGREITPELVRSTMKEKYVKTSHKDTWLGPLAGSWMHKEIYDDIIDSAKEISLTNQDAITKLVAPGGTLEKLTQFWKTGKVGLNPGSWVRNTAGNGMLLDFSTSTNFVTLSKMIGEEITNIMSGKNTKWVDYAKKHGLFSTTFSASEMYNMEQDFKIRFKQELKRKEKPHSPIRGLWWAQDKLLWLAEKSAHGHGLLEGLFKTVSMRDYVQRWEKQNNTKLERLSNEDKDSLLLNAARHANESIFDYSKVPEWLRVLRRTPMGSPFFTFIYKSFPALAKGTLKYPHKMLKYYMAPYLIAQAILSMSDFDEEEYEEALKTLPQHQADKSSFFVMPIKSDDGKLITFDASYLFPWAPFADMALKMKRGIAEGKIDEVAADILMRDLGVLGGPIPSIMSWLLVNKDPFTQKEIVQEGAPASDRFMQRLAYNWTLAMPPFLGSHGIVKNMYDQIQGETLNKYGTNDKTWVQDVFSGFGLTMGQFDPQENKINILKRFKYEESKLRQYYKKKINDHNTSNLERVELAKEMHQRLKVLSEKRTKTLTEGF